MLPNPEGIIARASNVSLDVTRLPRLSMLLAVATVLLLLLLPCACFLFPRVAPAALRPSLPPLALRSYVTALAGLADTRN